MLIKSDEFAESFWSKPLDENRVGWAIALEDPVWHEPVGRALRLDLLGCLAESQRPGPGEHIRNDDIVVTAEWIKRLVERYEVAGNKSRSLMNQLVKRMLAVSSRLTPVNRAGIAGDFASLKCDVFAIALHCQLLEISRESLQVLLVWKNRYCLCAEKVVVPNS